MHSWASSGPCRRPWSSRPSQGQEHLPQPPRPRVPSCLSGPGSADQCCDCSGTLEGPGTLVPKPPVPVKSGPRANLKIKKFRSFGKLAPSLRFPTFVHQCVHSSDVLKHSIRLRSWPGPCHSEPGEEALGDIYEWGHALYGEVQDPMHPGEAQGKAQEISPSC